MNQVARIANAARIASTKLADRHTPFLADCWYVAGFAEEFAEALRPRTILGKALVLYRTSDGVPVAMDDRCPHRSFPLSRSIRQGDTIVCGYHGLCYDRTGACVAIPGQTGRPSGIAVRSYPLREHGSLVWIWMGDSEPAAALPVGDWVADEARWPSSHDYFHLKANYIALHENLLDLSHLTFVHAASFGTPDYALAPYEVEVDDAAGRFAVTRSVIPTRLPPVWARPTGLEGKDAARIARSEFRAPSVHVVAVRFYDCALPEADRPDMEIATAHIVTPETATTTHYFIHHARNFAVDDSSITSFMHGQLVGAFREDVTTLEAVEAMIAETDDDAFYEVSLATDRAGLAMRRWLKRAVDSHGG
ncbi:MAG TPA: aromatic ring-hydroxylating dioxygenase subunit alpha [Sphingomonadaceae bacterium]|nr:aromatic ring-hydroxylating dioxygenase subunit alpha [Sphingomonadaceae bacterium]